MRKQWTAEIISSFFILLFCYTAFSKLSEIDTFKIVLNQIFYSFFGQKNNTGADIVAWSVPLSELAIVLLLFFKTTRLIGLYASLVLMMIFTLFIGTIILLVSNLPCNCGGVISRLGWKEHLGFNAIIIAMALWAIRKESETERSNILVHSS